MVGIHACVNGVDGGCCHWKKKNDGGLTATVHRSADNLFARQQPKLTQVDHLIILVTAALPEDAGALRILRWLAVRHIERKARPSRELKLDLLWGQKTDILESPKRDRCHCSDRTCAFQTQSEPDALLSCAGE